MTNAKKSPLLLSFLFSSLILSPSPSLSSLILSLSLSPTEIPCIVYRLVYRDTFAVSTRQEKWISHSLSIK